MISQDEELARQLQSSARGVQEEENQKAKQGREEQLVRRGGRNSWYVGEGGTAGT